MLLINTTPAPTPSAQEFKILSIDVWGNSRDGYDWNSWHSVGKITRECLDWTPRQLLKYFRQEQFLSEKSAGKCAIIDDNYNLIIIERANQRPLYAIEYGSAYL